MLADQKWDFRDAYLEAFILQSWLLWRDSIVVGNSEIGSAVTHIRIFLYVKAIYY